MLFEPLFTAEELAAELRIGKATVLRWVAEGHAVPAKRVGPRGICIFTCAELERLRVTARPRKPYTRRSA